MMRKRKGLRATPAIVAIAVIAVIAVLGGAGCGGDDDSSDETSETTRPDTGGALGEDEYLAVFSQSLQDGEDGFGASESEGDCAAEAAVASVGAKRLQAAGMDEEWLTENQFSGTDLTEDEADAVVDALFDCIDIGGSLAASLANEQAGLTEGESQCLTEELGDGAALKGYLSQLLREGSDVPMSVDTATVFTDAMLTCVDFGNAFASELTGADAPPLSQEQIDCLSEQLRNSEDYRRLLISELSGDGGGSDEEIGNLLLDEIGTCVDLAQLGVTPVSPNGLNRLHVM